MKKELYLSFFGQKDPDEIKKIFFATLLETNHEYDFFVDWKKVKQLVEKYAIELNILNTLIKSQNFDDHLRNILRRYPEVLPCFPLLLAIRDRQIKIADDFMASKMTIDDYDFSPRDLSREEIERVIKFVAKTGLKKFFQELTNSSLGDYMLGVEVGIDSNARKNRSGKITERLIEELLIRLKRSTGITDMLKQKKFSFLQKIGVSVPLELKERKADFIIVKKTKIINIETNFYNVSGSKPQEVVDAYINRQSELKRANFGFIWVTDGPGWKSSRNQIEKAMDEIDYILNTHFVRAGLLERILEEF